MNNFSDFNINVSKRFIGDKIKISRVLNIPIIVKDYKIEDSKYQSTKTNQCLTLQIEFEGKSRVLFTGSSVLMEQIKHIQPDQLPFKTTIMKSGESFEFR